MDNNSVKYSPWIKALCFALSVVMFTLSFYNGMIALRPLNYFSVETVFSKNKVGFYESEKAILIFGKEIDNLDIVCGKTPSEYKKELESKKEKAIKEEVQRFIDNKVSIIHDELACVAKGQDYENNIGKFTESYINSIPDTPEDEQKYPLDPYASANVRVACKVLNYAEGEELLKYENLVREDAFRETFCISFESLNDYDSYDCQVYYSDSVESAEKEISKYADCSVENLTDTFTSNYNSAVNEVSNLINIKYFIKNDKNIITNMTEAEQKAKDIKEKDLFYVKSDGKTDFSALPQWRNETGQNADYRFKNCRDVRIYMVGADELAGDDAVAEEFMTYNNMNYSILPYLIKAAAFLLVSLIALIVMLNLSGHKKGCDGITLSFIDKVPGDIHFAVSAVLIFIGVWGLFELMCELFDTNLENHFADILKPVVLIASAVWMIGIEWLSSVVRVAKSEKPYFGSFLSVKIIIFVIKGIKKLFRAVSAAVKNSVFRYKPKHLNKKIILIAAVVLCANLFVPLILAAVANDLSVALVGMFIIMLCDAAIIVYCRKYINSLDKIVDASQRKESVDFGSEKLPEALEILNNSLKYSNEELTNAVEKAVKNERTKTELITNVSHDLKTPLTSVISYVDLLKSCDIKDENALKYIDIISDKSANLKVLIENLIEASKVSAGNVKLNKANISLKELVIQSIVEHSSDFEKRNLDLRFNENCPAVTVFADGQQTYRIIENLVTNAKKYSAPGTRVYVSLKEENGFGVFEIKNMSNAPLDISPDELTERFVRGDASRGEEEGNGLGLSIAKELCSLQGGRLDISIDGDLFKATVYLPE